MKNEKVSKASFNAIPTPVQNKNSMHSCLKRAKINKTEELTPLMKFRTILPW